MRVLIIPSWYPTEQKPNIGIFFKEQAIALKESGVDVIVAYPEIQSFRKLNFWNYKRKFCINKEDGLETYRIRGHFPNFARIKNIIFYSNLKKIFKKLILEGKRPDVIHAHSTLWGGWSASKIAKEYKIPLIVTEHSTAFLRNQIKLRQVPYIKETYNVAKKIIAVGPGLEQNLQQYVDKGKIKLIPNIVDTSKFKINDYVKKSDKFRFFSLALLTHKKGLDTLLKSFALTFKRNKEVELIIGGNGEERNNLERLVAQLGIDDQVTFLGELTRTQAVFEMQMCDAFVLPSRFETFGVVFIEALACGKPIIATRCGGPEMFVNEENGILVEVDEIEDLSNALKRIFKNINNYNSELISEECKSRFSKRKVSEQIINEYKLLI